MLDTTSTGDNPSGIATPQNSKQIKTVHKCGVSPSQALIDDIENLKYIIAKEFKVDDILGMEGIVRQVNGKQWELYCENIANRIAGYVRRIESC